MNHIRREYEFVAPAAGQSTLDTVARLLTAFSARQVRYLHWKSNINVSKALMGKDDLDVLVHPEDADAAERAIQECGFARGLSHKDAWQKDIYHYFCADPKSGVVVHLHMHYSLTVGYDYHKNFTLPIVDWYMQGRHETPGIYIPQLEKEYILFLIRLLIKNARSVSFITFPRKQIGRALGKAAGRCVADYEIAEVEALSESVDRQKLADALATLELEISASDFFRYEEVIRQNSSRSSFYRAAADLKRKLHACRSTGEVASIALSFWRLNKDRISRVATRAGLSRPAKKLSANGGRIIAFVGGDGAGKSTNVSSLHKTLRRQFYAEAVHIGRPTRSPRSVPLVAAGRLMTALGARRIGTALSHLALAHDRRGAFRHAERVRARGGLAVLDRLPVEQVTSMDRPRIHEADNRILRLLQSLEQRLYREIRGVDLLIVLRLNPEIACQRRPEDDRETLLKRSGEVWRGDWTKPYMLSVDTGANSLEAVQQVVLARVWECIRAPFVRSEVVGLSGSGKSTLVAALLTRLSNAKGSLPYRRHPLVFAKSAAKAIWLTGVPTTKLKRQIFWNVAQLFAFQMLMKKWNAAGWPPHHFVLDQGPTFQIALCLKEGVFSTNSQLYRAAIGDVRAALDMGTISLEVPAAELRSRVRKRANQPTRASRMSDAASSAFMAAYAEAFSTVLADLHTVKHIVADAPIETVIDAAWGRLGGAL